MVKGYPVLKEDIFYATIYNGSDTQVKIRNTTTQKEFKATPATVALLDLCTGSCTVTEIVDTLSQQSGEPPEELAQDVTNILAVLRERGVIRMNETPDERIAKKDITLKYPLESAQIEITNRCNLSCVHCFNDSGNPYPNELTTKEIFSLIDTLSSMGVYQVTLSGGEPLIHPDLFRIIAHARKAPMSMNIFTNGTLITEKNVEKFKKYGIRRFNISIDSINESIHDTFRGKKGALKRTLQGITLLEEAGFSMKFSLCLSQLNKDSIIDILSYFKESNLAEFEIKPVRHGRDVDGLTVSSEEYYHVLVEQFTYLKEEFPEALPRIYEKTRETCDIGRNTIGIKADGTILPCPACDKEIGVGNVRDGNLEELWEENEILETIRNTTAQNDKTCTTCRYLAFCVGCPAGGFSTHGTLRCYYPDLCAVYRAYDDVFGL